MGESVLIPSWIVIKRAFMWSGAVAENTYAWLRCSEE